jgi:hypothetical protein
MDSSESSWTSSGHLQEAAEANFKHKSELLDEGLDESFPASDPTAISITRVVPAPFSVESKDVKVAEQIGFTL